MRRLGRWTQQANSTSGGRESLVGSTNSCGKSGTQMTPDPEAVGFELLATLKGSPNKAQAREAWRAQPGLVRTQSSGPQRGHRVPVGEVSTDRIRRPPIGNPIRGSEPTTFFRYPGCARKASRPVGCARKPRLGLKRHHENLTGNVRISWYGLARVTRAEARA
jgi:hypothetical protein